MHIIGSSGCGNSTVLSPIALQDIEESCGLVFIDPHGDTIRDLLQRIPEKSLDRVIWFDPGDSKHIPMWNPLTLNHGENLYRLADDTLSSIEHISRDWGDRLAMILRNGLLGLLQSKTEPVTLIDLYHLIRHDSPEGNALKDQIIENCADETVRSFWKHDFKDYKRSDLAAPKHKLDKLLSGGGIQLMFSQPDSRINIRRIMDEGSILLVDLSTVGEETRRIIGAFLLTQHMVAALGRSRIRRKERKPFSIIIDEAHLFTSVSAIENIITQARKYRIRLVLAHQFLKQFGRASQIDALSTTGSTLMGRLDRNDASYFAKDMGGQVKPDDITGLEPYRMFARLDTNIHKIATAPLPKPVRENVSTIIDNSRSKYYRPAQELRESLSKRSVPKITAAQNDLASADFEYDEF